jgi:hypothetical protein
MTQGGYASIDYHNGSAPDHRVKERINLHCFAFKSEEAAET